VGQLKVQIPPHLRKYRCSGLRVPIERFVDLRIYHDRMGASIPTYDTREECLKVAREELNHWPFVAVWHVLWHTDTAEGKDWFYKNYQPLIPNETEEIDHGYQIYRLKGK
jgi:hypothetical protein